MSEREATGPELMREAAADPTLDEVMRRDPATLSRMDIERLIGQLREERAMFIETGGKKKRDDDDE